MADELVNVPFGNNVDHIIGLFLRNASCVPAVIPHSKEMSGIHSFCNKVIDLGGIRVSHNDTGGKIASSGRNGSVYLLTLTEKC